MEFPEEWGVGGLRKNPFCGRDMDIFWNYTFWPSTNGLSLLLFLALLRESLWVLWFSSLHKTIIKPGGFRRSPRLTTYILYFLIFVILEGK